MVTFCKHNLGIIQKYTGIVGNNTQTCQAKWIKLVYKAAVEDVSPEINRHCMLCGGRTTRVKYPLGYIDIYKLVVLPQPSSTATEQVFSSACKLSFFPQAKLLSIEYYIHLYFSCFNIILVSLCMSCENSTSTSGNNRFITGE